MVIFWWENMNSNWFGVKYIRTFHTFAQKWSNGLRNPENFTILPLSWLLLLDFSTSKWDRMAIFRLKIDSLWEIDWTRVKWTIRMMDLEEFQTLRLIVFQNSRFFYTNWYLLAPEAMEPISFSVIGSFHAKNSSEMHRAPRISKNTECSRPLIIHIHWKTLTQFA